MRCLRECPTGSIPERRVLIEVETCLTLLNESEGDFPDWLEASAHNALIGCMRCQTVCPANRGHLRIVGPAEIFYKRETEAILRQTPLSELPRQTQEKLARIDMDANYSVLPRNLAALIG